MILKRCTLLDKNGVILYRHDDTNSFEQSLETLKCSYPRATTITYDVQVIGTEGWYEVSSIFLS